MEAAGAAITEQPLELALLEHPEAAGQIERAIGNPERGFDGAMLHRDQPQEPVGPDAAFAPVARDRFDMRPHCFEIHRDLGDAVLHLRMIRHRPRQRDRPLRLELIDDELAHAEREAVVDVRERGQRPGEKPEDEHVGAGDAGRDHARDVLVRDERAFEHGVVAARRAHAHDVPCVLDRVAFRLTRHEKVNDFQRVRIARVHGVPAEPRPHGRQAAERLPAGELVAAVDPLGLRRGEQARNVVPVLGMARREHLAGRGIAQDPLARLVARAPQVGRVADPVVVHVDAQRRRGRVLCEQARFARHLCERHALPAELLRYRHEEIAGGLQLVEVFPAKRVVAIVLRRPLAATVEKCLREHGPGRGHRSLLGGLQWAGSIDVSPKVRQVEQSSS